MKNNIMWFIGFALLLFALLWTASLMQGCKKNDTSDFGSRYTWCYQTPEGGNWLLYPSTVPPEKQSVPKGYVAVPCPKEEPYAE